MAKLTQKEILETFPLINSRELERRVGLKSKRFTDIKAGKSTLKADEIEKIREVFSKIPR